MTKQITTEERIRELITASPGLPEEESLCMTGNEYLSLPEIGRGGEIASINVLHRGSRGLLEFRGSKDSPLLAPMLKIDGKEALQGESASWSHRHDWMAHFEFRSDDRYLLEGDLFAPPGHRGCCYRLRLTNLSPEPLEAEMGWRGCWSELNYLIFSRRPIEGKKAVHYDPWTKSLLLEARSGLPLAALALTLVAGREQDRCLPWALAGCSRRTESEQEAPAEGTAYRGAVQLSLAPGAAAAATLFLAANLEADGAGTTAVDLKRRGVETLAAETERWLQERRIDLDDSAAAALLNRNLFFNYFYALGRALDDDSLVPVTSRSPRYYVSAAFWGRDTLLWSFPGLLLVDEAISRELLLTVFHRHLECAGEHAHYINGTLLYPGFELDQLAAYFLALERYESATGDLTLLQEKVITRGLHRLAEKALAQFDPESGFYRTFLDPADDPVLYPFLIYDNALLQCSFTYLAALQAADRWDHPVDFAEAAAALQQTIYRRGTVKGPRGIMFAWSVDGKGRFQLYDNPPGSLQLLSFYGFCSPTDRLFQNTTAWIRSPDNPHFHGDRPFAEAGSLHAPNPWPLAACSDILALNEGGVDFLLRAPLDNGFCCETVDPQSGRASTGAAFASAAGFLAYALWWHYHNNKAEAREESPREEEQ